MYLKTEIGTGAVATASAATETTLAVAHARAYAYLASHWICGHFTAKSLFFYVLDIVFCLASRIKIMSGRKTNNQPTKLTWLPEKGDVKLANVFFCCCCFRACVCVCVSGVFMSRILFKLYELICIFHRMARGCGT